MRSFKGIAKTTLLVAILAALVLMLPRAGAANSGSAVITGGHPATLVQGVTEAEFAIARRCAGTPQSQGADGYVIDLGGDTVPLGTQWVVVSLHYGVNVTINWQSF